MDDMNARVARFLKGRRGVMAALAAAAALLLVPAGASAASPVLEFVAPGHGLPVSFTTESGEVTAQMAGFENLVHCTASSGKGEITGPRSTISEYRFTGCTADGARCKSASAQNEEEITTGPIEADLVYIDQARAQVGILLNSSDGAHPSAGVYISFECGGIPAEGRGSFLAPGSPINQEVTSFRATLSQLDSVQTPDEYEDESGEILQAIPTGKRGSTKLVPTGVEATFVIHTSVPVEVKAITAQEVEAKEEAKKREEALQQQEAILKKLEEVFKKTEEHAKQLGEENLQLAATVKKDQEEAAAAKKKLGELEKTKSQPSTRMQLLARELKQCKKEPKSKRAQCEAKAEKKYGHKAKSGAE
jgi:hypothetical protein